MRKILEVAIPAVLVICLGWMAFAPAAHVPAHLGLPSVHAQQYNACGATGASPLNCQSTSYGYITIAAGASSTVVNTTAVTATSKVLVSYDYSVGGSPSSVFGTNVTCNTTPQQPYVSARTAGTSITVAVGSNFTTNPGCIAFYIVNP